MKSEGAMKIKLLTWGLLIANPFKALADTGSAETASAQAAGASSEQVAQLHKLQRQAQWRLDFVSSENSMGFHADQETARVLAESIDYARQAQAMAASLRAPAAPPATGESAPVEGVTPADRAPPAPYKGLTQPEPRAGS